jgi:L-aminopeptidase/D-esterase-like protein
MSADSYVSHDNTVIEPRTASDGPRLTFDFPGLRIGVAEYEQGPTGCTVFYFPDGVSTAVDERGGSVGAAETNYGWHHAICFAGGSLFGLEVIAGVRAELLAQQNFKITWETVPLVGGAIIWDWTERDNAIYPDKALGRAALRSAVAGSFPLGPRGAGRSARVGKWLLPPHRGESAGQGAAFFQAGPTKVLVFTVVNAMGAIIDRNGNVVRGHYDPGTGQRHRAALYASLDQLAEFLGEPSPGNTTLTLVVTNQKLGRLQQLARHVHSSMARGIYPFHTTSDGDILFAATTNEVENPKISEYLLSHIASELAWDAVLSSFDGHNE